jgi:transcription-repair coupling factor (superfamily II helicase)
MFTSAFDIDAKKHVTLAAAPFGHHARVLAELASRARPASVLYIAADDMAAAVTRQLVEFFNPHVEVLSFPAWDCLPYDRTAPSLNVMGARVECLTKLLELPKQPRLVITTAHAVSQKVPVPSVLRDVALSLKAGDTVDLEKLKQFFSRNGYQRVETVREAGSYAFRGSLIDVFPPGYANPLRIDLFGDEVETIRSFDALSQRTLETSEGLRLTPASELLFDEEAIARFRTNYRAHFGVSGNDPLYESVSAGRRYPGMEHWLPLFQPNLVSLTAYMENAVLVADERLDEAFASRISQIDDFYAARLALQKADRKNAQPVYRPLPPHELYIKREEWAKVTENHAYGQLSPFAATDLQRDVCDCKGARGYDFAEARAANTNVYEAVRERLKGETRHVLLACYSEGSAERLTHVLREHGLTRLEKTADWEQAQKQAREIIAVSVLGLERGFAAPDLLVLTEQDILGDRLSRPKTKRSNSDSFTLELSTLSEGDVVVHAEHGIGRYVGLETLDVGGAAHDCLKLVYDGGDRLYVPVENMDVLSRYGSATENVALDKLGSASWQGRKARVKKRLKDMAEALLKIAAEREVLHAEKIVPAEGLYEEFAARFPYAETEDQERAIGQVFDDLASGKPMDRLVCGDVGFGKTEVAIRAAFAAVQAGQQVAVVVPTTLLARQHFRTFSARFHGYPTRLGQLSRLVNAKEVKLVKDNLREGQIDIVIGTHTLLAKDIHFKNLGLLVVDEEQHFGVKQKEKLKELRAGVHVLTLTATPIPRTLQLALAGVRELSLIATPPVDRLAVRSFVLPYDGLVIREALMREHDRGGQTFYVCPRIEDLADLREQLQALVPELKLAVAHGKMGVNALEETMTAFDEARYDILLTTNIVESGLDIPNANTIIIHRADRFGLGQLYQLKGRVGRAKQRGYAYLTYDGSKPLTESARARLEVLSTLEGLGAGFQLASHDLDIRGAGNLLGEEQSGHIREVGIELYQQMLEDAVQLARAGVGHVANEDEEWTPQINLGMPVLIPESYVADLGLRLSLYRRAADLDSREAIEAFAVELIDRFGPLPNEVQNLMDTLAVKMLCRQSGVERLDAGVKGAVISFRNNIFARPERLIDYIQKNGALLKVRPDQKISVLQTWDEAPARVKGMQKILTDLARLAA